MTAIVLGKYFKVPADDICAAIRHYQPRNNRSQIIRRNGCTIFLDAYNANPSSVEAALHAFAEMEGKNKIAILGDMLELGAEAVAEHQAVVTLAQNLGIRRIILVGPLFAPIAAAAGLEHFDQVEDMREWFPNQDFSDCTLLIKGSRGIGLERLLEGGE